MGVGCVFHVYKKTKRWEGGGGGETRETQKPRSLSLSRRTRQVDIGDHSLRSAVEPSAAYVAPVSPTVAVGISAGITRDVVTQPVRCGDVPASECPQRVSQRYQRAEFVWLREG